MKSYREKLEELGYLTDLLYDKFTNYYRSYHTKYGIVIVTTKKFAKIIDIYPEVNCHCLADVEEFMEAYRVCQEHKKILGVEGKIWN